MVDPHSTLPVALITGGARRIGACIADTLHRDGYRVLVHHGRSATDAAALVARLNDRRPDSAAALQCDLMSVAEIDILADRARQRWGRVDLLVNNASTFFPTPLEQLTAADFEQLVGVNLRAPLFLTRALAADLDGQRGAVINLVDIYAERPLPRHAPYCAAKAGLVSITRSLARELAPGVRVNAVAPGAILWPEADDDGEAREALLARVPLGRIGDPGDIAGAVLYLAQSDYVTGQVLAVDGGRSVVA
jgi:pteridine reductase